MPRHSRVPGWVVVPGWQGPAVERRQAAATDGAMAVEHRCPRGTEGARPVWVSCVRNVETLLWVRIAGAGMRRRCGKPTVRGAEIPWRDRVPIKRMPGGRKAAGKRGSMTGDSSRVAFV